MGATLPELVERAKLHAGEKKIASSTVNKLLGGVQAVALWGFGAGSSSIVVHSGISLLGRGQSRLLTDVQSWSARPPIATLDPRPPTGSGGRAAYEKIWLVLRIQLVGSNVLAKEERFIP